jgi:uncharacterized protein (DUF305 family)
VSDQTDEVVDDELIDGDDRDGDDRDGDDREGDDRDDADSDDGEIVLPWWQHPVNILTMLVTIGLLAGMVGWMVGDSNGTIAHNEVDTGFLQDMREHHEQAVFMSFVYRSIPDIDRGLSTVAGSTIIGQSQEVGRMIEMLRSLGESEANEGETSMAWMGMPTERGAMPGMATEEQLEQLAASTGTEADELFVELMTAHHLGGIHMAEYAKEHAETDLVRNFAAAIINSQTDEIGEMQRELDS